MSTSFIGGTKGDAIWRRILEYYQDRSAPNYDERYNWNSIYHYAKTLDEEVGLPKGTEGESVEIDGIKFFIVDSLDDMRPYAFHRNMLSWG